MQILVAEPAVFAITVDDIAGNVYWATRHLVRVANLQGMYVKTVYTGKSRQSMTVTDLAFPMDFPVDFPTDFPMDFPTDFLLNFPRDFPADFQADFPTNCESHFYGKNIWGCRLDLPVSS